MEIKSVNKGEKSKKGKGPSSIKSNHLMIVILFIYNLSAVATLSTGPVAFGDKPGTEDMGLFMQCCRADGKILKPSRAISAIDAQIRGMGADIEHTTGPAKVKY